MRSTRRANLHMGWGLALALVALVLSLGSMIPELVSPWNPRTIPQPVGALVMVEGDETVRRLLAELEAPGEPARLEAAKALGRLGAVAAVEPLRAMLLEGRGAEMSVAATALGRIGSPAAIDLLLEALADRELTSRRHAAMGALEEMGAAAVDPLLEMLESNDATSRRNAVEMLGWIGSPSAVPTLEAMLADRDTGVRQQTAWSLAEIAQAQAGQGL